MVMILMFCIMSYVDASSPPDYPEDDNETFTVHVYDNFFGLENLKYGDVTKLDDLFLPPLDSGESETDDIKDEQELTKRKEEVLNFEEDFDILRPEAMTPDVLEYNDITKIVQNETRRYRGQWRGHTDHEDLGWKKWYNKKFGTNRNWPFEKIKKDRMSNMQLQWLVHTRIAVRKAMALKKDHIRIDKRYKIGYLISRLRIIKHEQQKITSFAQAVDKVRHSRGLTALLKFYEKMVRYDVDIKDTVRFIQALDKEPIPTTLDDPTSTPIP